MCIRVQYAPRDEIDDPWDAARNVIIIPDDLAATVLFTLRAIRVVLHQLDVEQPDFGARCWCGEPIELPVHTTKQRRSEEVSHLGA